MKRVLVIGGTRNLGHQLCLALLEQGWETTILNRGVTPDQLPGPITRLRADRQDTGQLKAALRGKTFDAIVDTALYNGKEARATVDLLSGQTALYVFISSGQVYLVRTAIERPFREEDYEGPVMPAPVDDPYDLRNWKYGVEKREVEDVLSEAWATRQFPYLTLRLPMVNSERDHYYRLYGYLLRVWDGGPILVPAGRHLSLRHVYCGDVVSLIVRMIDKPAGIGKAWNVGQDETVTIEQFLTMVAELDGNQLQLRKIAPEVLKQAALIPACSPFSDSWMSELDNRKSKQELGAIYTPLTTYLEKLVRHYRSQSRMNPPGYARRKEELELARA